MWTAEPPADGRRSTASRTDIGGGLPSRRARGDNFSRPILRMSLAALSYRRRSAGRSVYSHGPHGCLEVDCIRLARTGDVSWNALVERPRLMTTPAVVASSVRSAASIYMLAGRVLQSVVSVCLASLTFDPDFL